MVTEAALPSDSRFSAAEDRSREAEATGETTPGRDQEVRWEVVAVANGQPEAAIIRGRLEAEGIAARVQQEPAGAVIGLTVGLLGQVKVLVPEPLVDSALEVLKQPAQHDAEDDRSEPSEG
jgi:hypothetical protein